MSKKYIPETLPPDTQSSGNEIGVRPLGNRVVVRRDESKTVSDGGIALPDQSVEVPRIGTALAVGPGAWRYGNLEPCTVKPGDRVMFGSYAGNVAIIGGEELLVMCEDDILCVLDE
jgi:chaperonin GroES